MQKRIGKHERVLLNKVLQRIRKFKVFTQHKAKGETFLNNLLINHLKQSSLPVHNKDIPVASLFDERFRPECFVDGSSDLPLCAIECKKLTDGAAKARWKEGLSQAILYSHFYKSVALVFYDYTRDAHYSQRFSAKKSTEAIFAASLKQAFRIYVFVIPAQK